MKYIVICENGIILIHDKKNDVWNKQILEISNALNSIVLLNDNIFIATDDGSILKSANIVQWDKYKYKYNGDPLENQIKCIIYDENNNRLVAAGKDYISLNGILLISDDYGDNWNLYYIKGAEELNSICCHEGKYVAVDSSGKIFYSDDSITYHEIYEKHISRTYARRKLTDPEKVMMVMVCTPKKNESPD